MNFLASTRRRTRLDPTREKAEHPTRAPDDTRRRVKTAKNMPRRTRLRRRVLCAGTRHALTRTHARAPLRGKSCVGCFAAAPDCTSGAAEASRGRL